jgi:hypothetical protein
MWGHPLKHDLGPLYLDSSLRNIHCSSVPIEAHTYLGKLDDMSMNESCWSIFTRVLPKIVGMSFMMIVV